MKKFSFFKLLFILCLIMTQSSFGQDVENIINIPRDKFLSLLDTSSINSKKFTYVNDGEKVYCVSCILVYEFADGYFGVRCNYTENELIIFKFINENEFEKPKDLKHKMLYFKGSQYRYMAFPIYESDEFVPVYYYRGKMLGTDLKRYKFDNNIKPQTPCFGFSGNVKWLLENSFDLKVLPKDRTFIFDKPYITLQCRPNKVFVEGDDSTDNVARSCRYEVFFISIMKSSYFNKPHNTTFHESKL